MVATARMIRGMPSPTPIPIPTLLLVAQPLANAVAVGVVVAVMVVSDIAVVVYVEGVVDCASNRFLPTSSLLGSLVSKPMVYPGTHSEKTAPRIVLLQQGSPVAATWTHQVFVSISHCMTHTS